MLFSVSIIHSKPNQSAAKLNFSESIKSSPNKPTVASYTLQYLS